MNQPDAQTDLHAAIERHKGFAQADPDNTALQLALGDLYHRALQLEEALACYEHVLTATPDDPAAHGRIAAVKITQHQFDDAADIFSSLLDDNPDNPALNFNLGVALYYQQRWQDAKAAFDAALANGADQRQCLARITRCLHQLGETQQALDTCERWHELSQDTESGAYMALLKLDEGDSAIARDLALSVLAEQPTNIDANVVVGSWAVEEQELEQASQHFKNALAQDPNNPRAIFGEGLVALHQQQHDTAIDLMRQAVKLMPAYPGARIALGWAQLTKPDFMGAERTFREAIEVDRNFADAYGGLSYALAMQNRAKEAKEALEKATWLDPTSFGAVAARTAIMGLDGKHEQSTKMLANMLEQSPAPGQPPLIVHIQKFLKRKGIDVEQNIADAQKKLPDDTQH